MHPGGGQVAQLLQACRGLVNFAEAVMSSLERIAIGVVALAALGLPWKAQAAVQVAQTDIVSTATRLVSYRHQRHMFVTSDGRTHALMNLGTAAGTGGALYLHSTDDGVQWARQLVLPNTDANSVSDGVLTGDALTVVYQCSDGIARMSTLNYSTATRTWSLASTSKLPRASTSIAAVNPSFAVDANGNTWLAYVQEDSSSGYVMIALYVKAAGSSTWSRSSQSYGYSNGLTFGSDKRSARLVSLPGGIGLMYSVGPNIYWAERPLTGTLTSTWNSSVLMLSGTADNDPMSSHFSTVVDGQGNVYAAYTDAGVLYLRIRNAATRQWTAQTRITGNSTSYPSANPTYAQLAWLGGSKVALVSNFGAGINVYQSANSGSTWACTTRGVHTGMSGYFTDARLEIPAFPGATTVQVLQQYQAFQPPADGSVVPPQYAVSFRFAPSTTDGGCQ